jgi:hypothetical protein
MADRTVWKYPLAINALTVSVTNIQRIPKGAKFLHCAAQKNSVALWYEIPDPEAPKEAHRFQIFGTGNSPIGDHMTYVGSALFADGELVLHVYETPAEED